VKDIILDVREKDEYKAEYIEGSINIPLSTLSLNKVKIDDLNKDSKVTVMCLSGKRAQLALDEISKFQECENFNIYLGGITEWKKSGNDVITVKNNHLPIMRQVQLIAGGLVAMFSLLALFVKPEFLYGSLFVGLGLSFAGLTGFCGMAKVLAIMPWNK
jgi:rhodanese-related sulfurtransferase